MAVLMRRYAVSLVLLLVAVCPSVLRAENCPWLNAATAGGALDVGQTRVQVTHPTSTQTVCSFAPAARSRTSPSLQIVVDRRNVDLSTFASRMMHCGGELRPMAGVGNEALFCAEDEHGTVLQAAARIRDRTLLIHWRRPPAKPEDPKAREQKLQMLAESVAGNLF
jgi:hypothetical protein